MFFWILLGVGVFFTLLILFDLVPFHFRYVFLFVMLAGVAGSSLFYQLPLSAMGLGIPTVQSLIVYGAITILGALVIETTDLQVTVQMNQNLHKNVLGNSAFYLLISSPFQELLIHGYSRAMFAAFGWHSAFCFALFTAACFAFMHVFFKNKYLLAVTFLMGIVWGYTFYYFPDLSLISVSHACLGFILFGQSKQLQPSLPYQNDHGLDG